MRIGVIACKVFTRELCMAAARSQSICDLHFLPQGLHDQPDLLREKLQYALDRLEAVHRDAPAWRKLDAIALCYGLCGGGTAGLRAGELPVVIPRTDDCIGVLLGSQERYLSRFLQGEGIYWFSPGWLEYANTPSEQYYSEKFSAYEKSYGREAAEWLIQEENNWMARYREGVYISMPGINNRPFAERAQKACGYCGWEYREADGSIAMIDRLLAGGWDEQEFLVCPPHGMTRQSFDGSKLQADAQCGGNQPERLACVSENG